MPGAEAKNWHSEHFPECPEYEGSGKGTRPEVRAARVAADLDPATGGKDETGSCVGSAEGAQFLGWLFQRPRRRRRSPGCAPSNAPTTVSRSLDRSVVTRATV